MNVLSLFDGMSCGQIALQRAGIYYDNYYASEIDKYAIKVTQQNYPKTIQLGDIRNIAAKQLPQIDLLIGGSPCQGFSFAGKKLNFDDPRSQLFFEYVRLLKELKPKYFLLENVRMVQKNKDIISGYLGVEPIEINSALVSAQNRNRLYWTNIPHITPPEDKHIYLQDVIENGEALVSKSSCIDANYYKGGNNSSPKKQSGRRACISIADNGSYEVGKTVRVLTPLECERLQTVPEGYTASVSNTQRYKMLGNGWTIDIIAHILKGLHETTTEV